MVAGRGGGAAEAAVAVAPAPALSAMQRGSPERELAASWEVAAAAAAAAMAKSQAAEAEAEAEAEAKAEAEALLKVDAGAAGEPECPAREEQPKAADPAPARPRAAEEGDARVARRLPPAPSLIPTRPARVLCQLVKARSRGRGYRRGSSSLRPVTVDSSKARTSLEALKISLRQLRWKEVRPGLPWGHRGVVLPGLAPDSCFCL